MAEIELPREWLLPPRDQHSRSRQGSRERISRAFADPANNQFLLATAQHVMAVPLKVLDLPDEPLLWQANASYSRTAPTNEPWRASLEYRGDAVEVSLGKHPDGMRLTNRTIEWTPTEEHFGQVTVEIVAECATATRTETWNVRVEPTPVEMPFLIAGLSLSPDGMRAVAWGEQTTVAGQGPRFQRLVVVDLDTSQVVCSRRIDRPLIDAVISGEDVYVLSRAQLGQFSASTLESKDQVAVAQHIERLVLVADRFVAGLGRRRQAQRFHIPKLRAVVEEPRHDSSEVVLDGRNGFGWLSAGVLWDQTFNKPQLLAWPEVFRTASRQDSYTKAPNASRPIGLSSTSWFPFTQEQPKRPQMQAGEQASTIYSSPDLPVQLALVERNSQQYLAAFGLASGARVWEQGLSLEPPVGRGRGVRTSADRYVAWAGSSLYSGSLAGLLESAEPPFHIVPRQSSFLLSADESTTVKYSAVGARSFHLESLELTNDRTWYHDESTDGQFTISVKDILPQRIDMWASFIANRRLSNEANNVAKLDHYLQSVSPVFKQLFGREPTGVPIPIHVAITAEGKDFDVSSITHDFLVEIPKARFLAAMDRKYPRGRVLWQAGTTSEESSSESLTRPPLAGPLHTYMQDLLARPQDPVAIEALREQAQAAKQTGDEQFIERYRKWRAKIAWRTWTDKQGQKTEALLIQRFGGQVILRTKRSGDLVLDEDRLSQPDLDYLNQGEPDGPEDNRLWRQFVFQEAAISLHRFHEDHRFYPPRAIVDSKGNAKLSWRVLLLPQLGYEALYSLFRFNEPHGSKHNRELMAYMPTCFVTDLELAKTHKTGLSAVASPLSPLRTEQPVSLRTVTEGVDATIVFVEAAQTRSILWSQPADLRIEDFAVPKNVLRIRDEQTRAATLSGQAFLLPATKSREGWRKDIEIGDQRRQTPIQPIINGRRR